MEIRENDSSKHVLSRCPELGVQKPMRMAVCSLKEPRTCARVISKELCWHGAWCMVSKTILVPDLPGQKGRWRQDVRDEGIGEKWNF